MTDLNKVYEYIKKGNEVAEIKLTLGEEIVLEVEGDISVFNTLEELEANILGDIFANLEEAIEAIDNRY